MKSKSIASLIVAGLSIMCAPLQAHDFWIEPSTFRPAQGALFTAALRVGQNFLGDAVPRSSPLIEAFTVQDSKGTRPVAGLENRDPAGFVRVEGGSAIIGYASTPSPLEITSAKFAQFVHEEGLEQVVPQTALSEEPHREQFVRYAKSFVGTTDAAVDLSRPLGYRLELVPVGNPFATPSTTASVVMRVVFERKPLKNALVTAIAHDDPSHRVQSRTNAQGQVTLPLSAGEWLIKTTYIVPAPAGAGVKWESLWASLTFER